MNFGKHRTNVGGMYTLAFIRLQGWNKDTIDAMKLHHFVSLIRKVNV